MNEGVISKRYARALLEYCLEKGSAEKVYGQLCLILEGKMPQVLEEDLQRFLELLSSNGRLSYAKYIFGSYTMQYRRHCGIVQARLSTAIEDPKLDEQIKESLKDRFEGKMVFSHKVKPELIGGFVLEIDDKVMDTSVKSKLEKIRREFDDLNKRLV